jgi:hypothetical protein
MAVAMVDPPTISSMLLLGLSLQIASLPSFRHFHSRIVL